MVWSHKLFVAFCIVDKNQSNIFEVFIAYLMKAAVFRDMTVFLSKKCMLQSHVEL